jgi:hypothetical protein
MTDMKYTRILNITLLSGVMFFLMSCNGLFDDIYDGANSQDDTRYGFINRDVQTSSGTVYVNASSYSKWIFLDFHTLTIDSTEVADSVKEPAQWDIAIHHYDARTNSGQVIETASTDIDGVVSSKEYSDSVFTKDIWTTDNIIVDLSQMIYGKFKYADSYYNAVLSRWLRVDTRTMPPSYSMSGRVYVIRMKDGTCAAVKLDNYMNTAGVKGYLTIYYIYPLDV